MDILSGDLYWPKSEREVDPLTDRGIAEFLERCRAQERQEYDEEKRKEKECERIKHPSQCVLVSDGKIVNSTIRNHTDDISGETTEFGLGADEDGEVAGGVEREEGPVAGDYDGDDDE